MEHNEYDQIISHHYSNYRPPLHNNILSTCLSANKTYQLGLDIGCGTGQSTIALSHYCNKVIGIDPCKEMIDAAVQHPKITYQLVGGNQLPFDGQVFDVITFAGSLYYAKSKKLLDTLIKISKANAQIIIYDFELDTSHILKTLCGELLNTTGSTYNHKEDFSNLQTDNIFKLKSLVKKETLHIELEDIMHLLLSSQDNLKALYSKYGHKHIEQDILTALNKIYGDTKVAIDANLYVSVYELKK